MRKLLFIFTFSFILLTSCSNNKNDGITFFKGSWNELLLEAKKQKKPIFLDVYTVWCGPCKTLEKDVFTNSEVGKFYNQNFINYRLDAEKGEGIELSKKYSVQEFPTLLFLDFSSEVITQTTGAMPIKGFVNFGQEGLIKYNNNTSLSYYEKEYPNKKMDIKFLEKYLSKRIENNLKNEFFIAEYFKKIPKNEKESLANLRFIAKTATSINSPEFDILDKNLSKVLNENSISNEIVESLFRLSDNQKQISVKTKDFLLLTKSVKLWNDISAIRSKHKTPFFYKLMADGMVSEQLTFYRRTKNYQKFVELAQIHIDKTLMTVKKEDAEQIKKSWIEYTEGLYQDSRTTNAAYKDNMKYYQNQFDPMKTNAQFLNKYASTFFEITNDKLALMDALKWSKRSIELDNIPSYQDTYAHILYKLDRKEEAIKEEEKAIAKEKNNGGDTKQFEEHLAKMKEGTLLKK